MYSCLLCLFVWNELGKIETICFIGQPAVKCPYTHIKNIPQQIICMLFIQIYNIQSFRTTIKSKRSAQENKCVTHICKTISVLGCYGIDWLPHFENEKFLLCSQISCLLLIIVSCTSDISYDQLCICKT